MMEDAERRDLLRQLAEARTWARAEYWKHWGPNTDPDNPPEWLAGPRPSPQPPLASLPLLPADLTYVRVNGGRAIANVEDWGEPRPPAVGEHVAAVDGSQRLAAVIKEVRDEGTVVLEIPRFAQREPSD